MLRSSLLSIFAFVLFIILTEADQEANTDTELALQNGQSKAFQESQAINALVPLTAGVWTNFPFENVGINSTSTFTFNATTSGVFLITDLFWIGDSFAVYMNGSYVGSTCLVNNSTANTTTNPNVAYNQTPVLWSYHCFAVIPGVTTYVISPNQSPFTAGVASVMILFNGTTCPPQPNC